jgi:CheY-like chemotaxis protein
MELARAHRLDLIVLDFQMPLINGAGFLYRLREMPAHAHTPVMLVTGMAISAEQDTEFADLQAMIKLKPIEPSLFLADVARLVDAGRLSRTATRQQNAHGAALVVA